MEVLKKEKCCLWFVELILLFRGTVFAVVWGCVELLSWIVLSKIFQLAS